MFGAWTVFYKPIEFTEYSLDSTEFNILDGWWVIDNLIIMGNIHPEYDPKYAMKYVMEYASEIQYVPVSKYQYLPASEFDT